MRNNDWQIHTSRKRMIGCDTHNSHTHTHTRKRWRWETMCSLMRSIVRFEFKFKVSHTVRTTNGEAEKKTNNMRSQARCARVFLSKFQIWLAFDFDKFRRRRRRRGETNGKNNSYCDFEWIEWWKKIVMQAEASPKEKYDCERKFVCSNYMCSSEK